jgi:RNA polymerase subunit RPABC4/transcription elongation factor Spt4
MKAPSGRMALLLILLLVLFFVAFVLTPLALAPLGVFTGVFHGVRGITFDAWHFRPWFPFFPIWGMSLFFVILWIAVIVWVYKDAERRGMSGLLWSLLVFFGSVVGLLIFLIVRQDHPVCCEPESPRTPSSSRAPQPPSAAQAASAPSGGSAGGLGAAPQAPPAPPPATLTCPSCKKPVEKAFTYCPYCGAALQPVCKNCGKPVDASWKACPYCGSTLKSE